MGTNEIQELFDKHTVELTYTDTADLLPSCFAATETALYVLKKASLSS